MARVNIEECWWTDPRREMLARLLKSKAMADGVMIAVWRLAQQFRGKDSGVIPLDVWSMVESNSSIVEAKLADLKDDGAYIRGSKEYLDWIVERRAAGSNGGRRSAYLRVANAKQTQANAKQIQPSGSGSGSDSKNIKSKKFSTINVDNSDLVSLIISAVRLYGSGDPKLAAHFGEHWDIVSRSGVLKVARESSPNFIRKNILDFLRSVSL